MITGTGNYDEALHVPCKICGGYFKADAPENHVCHIHKLETGRKENNIAGYPFVIVKPSSQYESFRMVCQAARRAANAPTMDVTQRLDALTDFRMVFTPELVDSLLCAAMELQSIKEAQKKVVFKSECEQCGPGCKSASHAQRAVPVYEPLKPRVVLPVPFEREVNNGAGKIYVVGEAEMVQAIINAGCTPIHHCEDCGGDFDLSSGRYGAHYCHKGEKA